MCYVKKKMELRNRESLDTSMNSKENAADLFYLGCHTFSCDPFDTSFTMAVSYTHLDVYKRQALGCIATATPRT